MKTKLKTGDVLVSNVTESTYIFLAEVWVAHKNDVEPDGPYWAQQNFAFLRGNSVNKLMSFEELESHNDIVLVEAHFMNYQWVPTGESLPIKLNDVEKYIDYCVDASYTHKFQIIKIEKEYEYDDTQGR